MTFITAYYRLFSKDTRWLALRGCDNASLSDSHFAGCVTATAYPFYGGYLGDNTFFENRS